MSKNTILVLSQSQIKKIIPLTEIKRVMERVEKAFLSYGQKKVQMPCKTYLYFKKYNGDLRIMPSFASELDMAGTKIVNVHPENPKKGLPTVMAAIILNDAKTGLPVALLDGTYITGMRTGAAGGVASKYLARNDAKTLGVVGAGVQSLFQIAAICRVRKIKEIFVFDINQEKIKWLSKQLKCLNLKIKTASLGEAARQDILVTVTPSEKPIIKKEWIKPGTHINAIGADAQGKEELDPMILKKGKIFIDDWAQASHSGEINVPFKKGIIKEKDICASLGEVVSGQKIGRTNDKEITIFDSTGLAIQDLFTAHLVYQIAKKKRIGKKINLID
jgi:alanine dehydrogenase